MSHQTNNLDGNAQLHLNAKITKTTYATAASPVRNNQSPAEVPRILQAQQQQPRQQQQLGDVYEFHSSPEEEDMFSAAGPGYFPITNAAICSQQKSSSTSSIPNILATTSSSCPPPKRIKTAVLAKKLLAAAVDSNIIDPLKLPKPTNDRKNIQHERIDGDGLNKNDETITTNLDNLIEENYKEIGGNGDNVEAEVNEEDIQQKQRANSFGGDSINSHEQKKVPPLRISLLKTPSEEGEGSTIPSCASSPSGSSNLLRKTRAVRIGTGLRKVGEGHESKKENLQRVTRSRVKQINSSNETGDLQHGRKRRNKGIEGGVNNEFDEVISTSSTLSVRNFPFEEEDNTMINDGTIENGTAISRNLISDDDREHHHEDSQQCAVAMMSIPAEEKSVKLQPSTAALMLNKNSLEQTVAFESMIREKWTSQYKAHLSYVIDKVYNANFIEENISDPCKYKTEMKLTNEWPEQLKKLFAEQEKRRRDLGEEHQLDRERIQKMAQREIARFEQTNLQNRTRSDSAAKSCPFSIVSYLRDMECYDPGLLAESLNSISSIYEPTSRFQNQSFQQIQQRFTYLVNTTKNRHTLEAHSLVENQKAEWKRIARRIQRENEQQQLMLKGPIGSAGKQQQHLTKISFPSDFWVDSAVHQIQIYDIQILQFHQKHSPNKIE